MENINNNMSKFKDDGTTANDRLNHLINLLNNNDNAVYLWIKYAFAFQAVLITAFVALIDKNLGSYKELLLVIPIFGILSANFFWIVIRRERKWVNAYIKKIRYLDGYIFFNNDDFKIEEAEEIKKLKPGYISWIFCIFMIAVSFLWILVMYIIYDVNLIAILCGFFALIIVNSILFVVRLI